MSHLAQILESIMKGGAEQSAELTYYFHPRVWQLPDMWAVPLFMPPQEWEGGLARGWRTQRRKAMEIVVWCLVAGDGNGG